MTSFFVKYFILYLPPLLKKIRAYIVKYMILYFCTLGLTLAQQFARIDYNEKVLRCLKSSD